jgi:hypothetical protein
MNINVLVSAQYYENYSEMGNSPYWKPKGGVDFIFPVDSDLLMYAPQGALESALGRLVEAQSNGYARYEYLSHEVKFGEPTIVEGLDRELEREWELASVNY